MKVVNSVCPTSIAAAVIVVIIASTSLAAAFENNPQQKVLGNNLRIISELEKGSKTVFRGVQTLREAEEMIKGKADEREADKIHQEAIERMRQGEQMIMLAQKEMACHRQKVMRPIVESASEVVDGSKMIRAARGGVLNNRQKAKSEKAMAEGRYRVREGVTKLEQEVICEIALLDD